jgi:hypothetical protein
MKYKQFGGKMPEIKSEQKNWRFTPQIISELGELCIREMRSEQNMIEVLIHREFERIHRLNRCIVKDPEEERENDS